MPLIEPSSNKISVDFEARIDQFVSETQKLIREVEKTKDELKAQQKAMNDAAKASEAAAKKSTMSWTDFRSMYSTVLDVVRVGQAIWAETGQKFIDYSIAAGDMARSLGTTTEEASRLMQVTDDVGISVTNLKTAMKLAAKDGIQANTEGLAQLSEQYLALAPGVDRAQFLMDKFGKSGLEMGKLLEKGGDSIRKMSAAVDESMIVTQQAYEEARQYEIAMDSLKDSWDALTYKAAPPLIRAMTQFTDGARVYIKAITDADPAHKTLAQSIAWATEEVAKENLALLDTAESADGATEAFETEAEAQKKLAEATKEASKAAQEYLSFVGNLTDTIANHREKEAELTEQYNTGKITLDEYKQKWGELADEQEAASRRMILNMLEQQLMVDGLTEKEAAYLLDTGLKWGVYSEEAVTAAKQAQEEVRRLTDALNNLPTEKNITISAYYQQYGDVGDRAQTQAGGYAYGHATGGTFMIPQSYGNEGFRMGNKDTASGGEMVTITPKGQTPGADNALIMSLLQSLPDAIARANRSMFEKVGR